MVNCWAGRWGVWAANSMIVMERMWARQERASGLLRKAADGWLGSMLVGRELVRGGTSSEAKRFRRDGLVD